MAKNLMVDVVNLLGLEFEEEFAVKYNYRTSELIYRFTDKGLFYCEKSTREWYPSKACESILTGEYEIVKLPYEPKEGDIVFFPEPSIKCVDQYHWTGDAWDLALKALGMVYRTQAEAEKHFPEDYERLTGKKWEE